MLVPQEAIPGEIIATPKQGIVVCCGTNSALTILSLQLPSRKQISARDALNSKKDIFSTGNFFESIAPEKQSS